MFKTLPSYRKLTVWQKSVDLAVLVYELTSQFPSNELYGLVSQLRRAAVSIASNIAEGSKRTTRKEFMYFLRCAYGSGAEIETQLEIVQRLPFGKKLNVTKTTELLVEIMKMLNVMTH